jgi:hypothetical protein
MEVTKKEEQRENKEVKRPQIDPAIIEELMKGWSVVRRPPKSQSSMPSSSPAIPDFLLSVYPKKAML